ncbi:helix-turn-helix domain-containing protein [Rhodobacterales bacterium HKCCE3408]|nr:helix-turn-helix domain-containing protein [Rhodobacterales bacterium HKCCE3408]
MLKPAPARRPGTPQFLAERISAGLQDRFIGSQLPLPEHLWRVVFLQAGAVQVLPDRPEDWLEAPAILWHPWSPGHRLRVRAGSDGATLILSEQMLANTLGHKPEAADLRQMLQHPVAARLHTERAVRDDIAQCFRQILREAAGGGPGSATLVEAQCRVIAVLLWRLFRETADAGEQAPSEMRNLQMFRLLLETHFRQRWTVRNYSAAMGMSADRLHDLCRRALGKPPKALIRERLAYEAQLLLSRSGQPIAAIADQLGFVDAPQFSKFIRQEFGQPPAQFRRRMAARRGGADSDAARSFADWP